MEITVRIPDELSPALESLTERFGSIDQVISRVIREEADRVATDTATLPYEQWKEKFDAMIASAEPGNHNVDDSREAIYADRG